MNTYKITYQGADGVTGIDYYTATTEEQARKDFMYDYRSGGRTIKSVELSSKNAPATKEQERKALAQIKKIVDSLGEDSYIGTAFEGCFEIAESNIENDFACSMKQRYERASEDATNFQAKAAEYKKQVEELAAQLEWEQEWKPYEDKANVLQEEYECLVKQGDTRYLTDDEAKDLLYSWYGFAKEKVIIYHSLPKYEANRHRLLRKVGDIDRRPAYNATDWYYIRFDCGQMMYELYNDDLRFFAH